MSRSEEMAAAILNGEIIISDPLCRKEQFLKAIANNEGTANLPEPNCRKEQLLYQIAEQGLGGSEDLDAELTAIETSLNSLESDVNALTDKPMDTHQLRINNGKTCSYLFYKYFGTNLDFVKGLDTSPATSMAYMFSECIYLASLDISNFDTSNVTTMMNMFYNN